MKKNRIIANIAIIITILAGCTPHSTNDLNCHYPGSNTYFDFVGVSSFDGFGSIHDDVHMGVDTPYTSRYLGIVGYCDPSNPSDSLLRIHFPYHIPDTPYTFPLVNSSIASNNEGYVFAGLNYQTAHGALTIDTITTDSFASGHFHFTGTFFATQTWGFYNHSTNTMEYFPLDSICILNGTFSHVKIH